MAPLGSPGAGIDALGAAFAFGSAACWATYIVLAKRLVGGAEPLPVLTFTLAVAAVVLAGPALATPGGALAAPPVLATAFAVAARASAIPYLLELIALRLVSAAMFNILLTVEPANAVLVGLVALGQALGAVEVAAVGCVVVASAGAARAACA